MEPGGEVKEKKMIGSTTGKYLPRVQVEDILICIESCRIMGRWREWVRETNRGRRTDQSGAYLQLGYVEKSL
jgi:hypothetical protein